MRRLSKVCIKTKKAEKPRALLYLSFSSKDLSLFADYLSAVIVAALGTYSVSSFEAAAL